MAKIRAKLASSATAALGVIALGASAHAVTSDPEPPMTMELAKEITESSRTLSVEEVDRYEEALTVRWGSAGPDVVGDKIAQSLRAIGRFGGATWDPEAGRLHIYVAGPQAGRDIAVKNANSLADEVTQESNVAVQVHSAGTRTESELISVMDKVADVEEYDPSGIVSLRGGRIDYGAGVVEIDVTSQKAADLVEAEFGTAIRTRVRPPLSQADFDEMFQAENRRADSPSNGWNGGTAMCTTSYGDCSAVPNAAGDSAACTTGLKWVLSNHVRLATAGHCFMYGDSFYRYLSPRYSIATQTGTIWQIDTNVDGALADPPNGYSVRNEFWIGSRYSSDSRTITAWDDSLSVGQPLLVSGANSGSLTGTVVDVWDRDCNFVPTTATTITGTVSGDSGATVAQPNAASPEAGDYVALGVHSCKTGGTARFSRAATIASVLGGYPATY